MQNLVLTFNIVAPFILYMLFGALLKRLGFMTPDFTEKLNKIVSGIVLPIFNFYNFIQADLSALKQGDYIIYVLIGQFFTLVFLVALHIILKRSPARAGAMVVTNFVNNTMVFGNAIALSMYGAGNFAPMLLVAAVLLPVYNALVIPLIQSYGTRQRQLDSQDNEGVVSISAKQLFIDTIKNPLIIAVILGVACSLLKVQIPVFANTFISGVSGLLTPLLFMVIGARISFSGLKDDAKDLIICASLKLIIFPLIFVSIAINLGWRNVELFAILMAFASPCGVTSVPVAKMCGCDDSFAGEMLALSSSLAMFTIFIWLFVLKTLAFI